MIGTPLHWVDGPWLGRMALAARPRGGDWLDDEIAGWQREGVDVVLSLLEREEKKSLSWAESAAWWKRMDCDSCRCQSRIVTFRTPRVR